MSKTYKCPYCNERYDKYNLIYHIEKDHEDLIPEKQTPTQVVFNYINKKDHGTCVVCGKETKWNEKTGRYNRLCDNPKCREKLREEFKKNAVAAKGTYNFTADPKFQEKMLRGRKISSTYTFTDGEKVDYVGSYEKKFLEFVDKVMNIESKDIISPGPTIPYEFEGKTHFWITDFYYIPANLVLDIKDGGKNPNNRPMEEYREKQIAKENAIRKLKKYNYLRLTDNNFGQFMEVLVDLKSMALDLKQSRLITQINESTINELSAGMSTVPPQWSADANVMITNNINGENSIALSSLDFNDNILIDDDEEGIKKISREEFKKKYSIKEQFLYPKNEKYYHLLEAINNHTDDIYKGIYYNLSSFDNVLMEEEIYFDKEFRKIENNGIDKNVFDLSKKVEKVNDSLELDIKDDSIGITLPKMNFDNDYDVESILKNGKPTTRIKIDNSVVATFNKTAQELGILDYEKIEESANILLGRE